MSNNKLNSKFPADDLVRHEDAVIKPTSFENKVIIASLIVTVLVILGIGVLAEKGFLGIWDSLQLIKSLS